MLPALMRRRPGLRRCWPRSPSLRPLASATTPPRRAAEGGDGDAGEGAWLHKGVQQALAAVGLKQPQIARCLERCPAIATQRLEAVVRPCS